jgi:hypothetical protein
MSDAAHGGALSARDQLKPYADQWENRARLPADSSVLHLLTCGGSAYA